MGFGRQPIERRQFFDELRGVGVLDVLPPVRSQSDRPETHAKPDAPASDRRVLQLRSL